MTNEEIKTILKDYAKPLERFALALGVGEGEFEDVLQDVLVAMIAGDAEPVNLFSYTKAAVRNRVSRVLQDRTRRGAESAMVEGNEGSRLLPFEELVGDLAAFERDVLRWRYVEGLTGSEIAERLEISVDAAKKKMQRAVGRLRAYLVEAG